MCLVICALLGSAAFAFYSPLARSGVLACRAFRCSGVLLMASGGADKFNALTTIVRIVGLHPKLGDSIAMYVCVLCVASGLLVSCTMVFLIIVGGMCLSVRAWRLELDLILLDCSIMYLLAWGLLPWHGFVSLCLRCSPDVWSSWHITQAHFI